VKLLNCIKNMMFY